MTHKHTLLIAYVGSILSETIEIDDDVSRVDCDPFLVGDTDKVAG